MLRVGVICIVLAAPFAAAAQAPAKIPVVAYVGPGSQSPASEAVVSGMKELGYVEGRNVAYEFRFWGNNPAAIPSLVAELVAAKVDVIVASGGNAAPLAAREATRTIPIVFPAANDPVERGLVASLARPGGNATGLVYISGSYQGKRLQILKEAASGTSRVAVLSDSNFGSQFVSEIEGAARSLGIAVRRFEAARVEDFVPALRAIADWRADAVMVMESPLFAFNREQFLPPANSLRLPFVCPPNFLSQTQLFAEEACVVAYGPSLFDGYRRAAGFVDKILKGANPAELPVEEPTKFETIVNLKAARALGIAVPQSIVLRADKVIE